MLLQIAINTTEFRQSTLHGLNICRSRSRIRGCTRFWVMSVAMKLLPAFARDQNGAVAIIFGICLLPVLAAVGAATDYSFAAFRKNTLQKTADAAALAGAVLPEAPTAEAEAAAKAFFLGNDPLDVTPAVSATAEAVTVSATYSQPTFIMHVLGTSQTTVSALAVAARSGPKPPCVQSLDPAEKHGIILNSQSKLQTDCGVQVNSSNAEALVTNSDSVLKSEQTCVTGGWNLGSGVTTPAPKKCPRFRTRLPVFLPLQKQPEPALRLTSPSTAVR
jgi:Flp pilus assembly protein TadG